MTTETTEYRCPHCGSRVEVLVRELENENDDWVETFQAYCKSDGNRSYECCAEGPRRLTETAALEAFCNHKAYSERMKNGNH
jgi:DNA-directed RNA polymerase subunit RPC12/RpoP